MNLANKVLMIRPAKFYSNPDTASDNSFQIFSSEDLTSVAQKEFDHLVMLLRNAGISVSVIQDDEQLKTPDSIFPNNRISFHSDGLAIIYPMKALNRRKERELPTLSVLEQSGDFKVKQLIDYSIFEQQELYLEGTGSMIIDKFVKTIYLARSQRSEEELALKLSKELGYDCIVFDAETTTDAGPQAIYHTNVMLAIAENFVVIAKDAIKPSQQKYVLQHLEKSGRIIVSISLEQMTQFCGNILQLEGRSGNKIIAMSESAMKAFTSEQLEIIQQHNEIVSANISTIERASGGSVRCMLAEIF